MNPESGNPTAVPESSPEIDITSLTDTQHRNWRMTGQLPEVKPSTQPAESSTAPPTDEDSATSDDISAESKEASETAAAPETATQQEERRKSGTPARERVAELLADRKKLTLELEDLRKKVASATTAAPSASPTETKQSTEAKPDAKPAIAEPKLEDFTDWNQYQAAREKWLRDDIRATLKAEREAEAKQAEAEKAQKAISERWNKAQIAAETKYSDFKEVAFGPNGSQRIPGDSVIGGFLADSELGPEILYHLAQNPDETARIQALNPFSQTRALVKIEDKLSASSDVTPPAKQISQAPPPPKEIGGNGTTAADEVVQALKNDDFETFKKAQNRRDIARRKG